MSHPHPSEIGYSRNPQEVTQKSFLRSRLSLLPGNTILSRAEGLGLIGEPGSDSYRNAFIKLCRIPAIEDHILEGVDRQTRVETRKGMEHESLSMDALIVGTGPAGVTLSTRIRELLPRANLWMADERDYRGGQFADNGYNFLLNTPRTGPKIGFPQELPDPNNLGHSAFIQVVDLTDEEEYSRKNKLVTCLKVDGFVAAPALAGVGIVSVRVTEDVNYPYQVLAIHRETGNSIMLYPQVVAFARGRGKPKYGVDVSHPDTQEALARREKRIYVSELYNKHINDLSPREVLQEIQNRVGMIGAGDTANTALEAIINKLLTFLTPSQIQQYGIDVYGAKYTNAEEFRSTVRIPRYDGLIPYVGNFISPQKEKAESLSPVGEHEVGVATQTSLGVYGTIAMMTGYQNEPIENLIDKTGGAKLVDIIGKGDFEGELMAQQIEGENIFVCGVDVREQFSGTPPLFARSIVRHTPRILKIAERIAETLQQK